FVVRAIALALLALQLSGCSTSLPASATPVQPLASDLFASEEPAPGSLVPNEPCGTTLRVGVTLPSQARLAAAAMQGAADRLRTATDPSSISNAAQAMVVCANYARMVEVATSGKEDTPYVHALDQMMGTGAAL